MIVYKYKLHPYAAKQKIQLHKNGLFLKLGIQDKDAVMWVSVDINEPEETVVIHSVGTGEYFTWEDKCGYLDTLIYQDGTVMHYFIGSEE